ncbi:hypothetical protein QF026_004876 [Streptomyces aurantiacus]|nr:hypothetical protein [Streptomyces aurantiacus]
MRVRPGVAARFLPRARWGLGAQFPAPLEDVAVGRGSKDVSGTRVRPGEAARFFPRAR